ncbi:MAG TPA: hypothetical protein VHZ02_03670, partial [Acidimicrobiales bacterium]|nr:hypothetical protein [Acidimicrobiales bacterium]
MDTAATRCGVHPGRRLRAEGAPGLGRRGVSGMLAALTTIVIAAVVGPTGAGAAPSPSVNVGALRP